MNKLVSIITPSYNSSRFIEECVGSVIGSCEPVTNQGIK